jgi:hypothetical protein
MDRILPTGMNSRVSRDKMAYKSPIGEVTDKAPAAGMLTRSSPSAKRMRVSGRAFPQGGMRCL